MKLSRRLWLAVAMLLAAPLQAASLDCDGVAATTLQPAEYRATDARAYWLDAAHVRWP